MSPPRSARFRRRGSSSRSWPGCRASRSGDIIVADDDGVVVVPVALAPELLKKASEHVEWEEFSRMRLAQGGELRKYYPLSAEARVEYEEWRKQQGS